MFYILACRSGRQNNLIKDGITLEPLQTIILAILQGLTEFLPISSSAHLILVPILAGWDDQGLAFDVAVHVGTLTAVVAYLRHELALMTHDWFLSLLPTGRQQRLTTHGRLAWGIIIATIPVAIAGFMVNGAVEDHLRSPLVIAATTIIFALVLAWAFHTGNKQRNETSLIFRDFVIIGLAQAIALIPGTSRSGITITAGLLLGLEARAAARFSFLLSIPTITAAGGLKLIDLVNQTEPVPWESIIMGTAISAISAYLCIHWFLKLLDKIGMAPFVIYRLILGAVLFWVFWPASI